MEEQIKISIIMPVYKVERYVGKAIESILSQTLEEFEFLIVDDGTPDQSGKICDEYAKKDQRIRVIHKENGGAPSARNQAMDVAKGKYYYFLDSDDWTEPEMLEELYNLAEKNQAQLVIAGFYIDTYYEREKYITKDYIPWAEGLLQKKDFKKNAYKLFDNNMLYPPWNKLYLRAYIQNKQLYFPNTMWDDFPFNLSVIRDIERVYVTTKQYYHFLRARSESETAKYVSKMYDKRKEEHKWLLDLYEYWGITDKESREMLSRRYIDRLIGCFENLTNPKCTLTQREIKQELKSILTAKNTRECLKMAKPKTIYLKLLYFPLRLHSVFFTLLEARTISYVKTKNVKLFTALKINR